MVAVSLRFDVVFPLGTLGSMGLLGVGVVIVLVVVYAQKRALSWMIVRVESVALSHYCKL